MPGLTSYFDLLAGFAERRIAGSRIPERPPILPQYLALAAGVVSGPFLNQFIQERTFDIERAFGSNLLFGLIAALVVFPVVYRNAFDPERPIFVQLCAIFASGIGWQSLFQAATGGSGVST
jgi:hypothetical protein